MINLCLVVIATQFSETKRRETERMQHERALRRRDSGSSGGSVSPALSTSVSVFSTSASCYSELVRYVEHLFRRAWRRLTAAVVEYRLRRRAAAAANQVGDGSDELGTLQRQRGRRRRGRRKGTSATAAADAAVEVEMNSVGSLRSASVTGTRRHVTVASPSRRRVVSGCDTETPSIGADDVLTVTVRPASPLAPRASPEPSEVDQSSLALNRSVSGEPRLMPPSTASTQTRNPRWSSPTGIEEFDVSAVRRSDDVNRSHKPRSASSPRLHSLQTRGM